MHSTFVSLALAVYSLISLVSCSAIPPDAESEYRRQLNVLDNMGRMEKRQAPASMTTFPGGVICTENDWLQALQTFSSDAVPFCSSYISIQNFTTTTAYTTAYVTAITTITSATPFTASTAVPSTTTTVISTITSYFTNRNLDIAVPSPAPTQAPEFIPGSEAGEILKRQASSACNDTFIESQLSSGCSCLHITPTTVGVCQTATVANNITVIDFIGITTLSTYTNGVYTTVVSTIQYLPLSKLPTSSSRNVTSTTGVATFTSPATTLRIGTSTLPSNGSLTTLPGTGGTPSSSIPVVSSVISVPGNTQTTVGPNGSSTITTTALVTPVTLSTITSASTSLPSTNVTSAIPSGTTSAPTVIVTIPGTTHTIPGINGSLTTTTTALVSLPTTLTSVSGSLSTLPVNGTSTGLPGSGGSPSYTTPGLTLPSGYRTIVTLTGPSGVSTVTEQIGNNYTITLPGTSTTTTTTQMITVSPIPANSTSARPSSGFPTSSSNITIPGTSGLPSPLLPSNVNSALSGGPTAPINGTIFTTGPPPTTTGNPRTGSYTSSSAPSGVPTGPSNITIPSTGVLPPLSGSPIPLTNITSTPGPSSGLSIPSADSTTPPTTAPTSPPLNVTSVPGSGTGLPTPSANSTSPPTPAPTLPFNVTSVPGPGTGLPTPSANSTKPPTTAPTLPLNVTSIPGTGTGTGIPTPSANSTRPITSATGTIGFPTTTSNISTSALPTSNTTVPASIGTITSALTANITVKPTLPPSPPSFSNIISTEITTTLPNGQVTSYPYYQEAETFTSTYNYTRFSTTEFIATFVSASTSYSTTTLAVVFPNGTGSPSYSILAPTVRIPYVTTVTAAAVVPTGAADEKQEELQEKMRKRTPRVRRVRPVEVV